MSQAPQRSRPLPPIPSKTDERATAHSAATPEDHERDKRSSPLADKFDQFAVVLTSLTGCVTLVGALLTAIFKTLVPYLPNWATPWVTLPVGLGLVLLSALFMLRLRRRTPAAVGRLAEFSHNVLPLVLAVCLIAALPLAWFLFVSLGNLRQITAVHSTEYVGQFPNNMESIIDLVKSTRHKLVILVDFPAYGKYSAPDRFDEYKAIVARLVAEHKDVTIRYYDGEQALKQTYAQFQYDPKAPAAERSAVWIKFTATSFYTEYCARTGLQFADMESLARQLIVDDDVLVNGVWKLRSSAGRVSGLLPVFAWIVDDERAIYSFYNVGPAGREAAFMTNNKRMVEILSEIASAAK